MIKNYLKSAYRNLLRNRIYTLINIVGLTMGISSCLFISIYIHNELSHDNFHKDSDSVFRVKRYFHDERGKYHAGVTSGPFAEALVLDYPQDVLEAVRVFPGDGLVANGERSFMEDRIFLADSNFFNLFTFPIINGDAETALRGGNSILISTEMATKYFGDEDPINQTLEIDNRTIYQVTGVFDASKVKSHLEFDFLGSIQPLSQRRWFNDWWSNSFSTYIKLKPGASAQALQAQLPAFMDKYFGEDFKRVNRRIDLHLENVEDIYFNNETRFDQVNHGDRQAVTTFSIIAFLILFLALINFVNLSTATASRRAVEIGVRKTNGATRQSLFTQFLVESAMVSAIAVLLSLFIAEIGLPNYSEFVGKQLLIPVDFTAIVIGALGATALLSFIAGFYPAMVLSAYQPSTVIRNQKVQTSKGLLLRKGLVVFQFGISILLIIATLITANQFDFIQNKNLGFDKESTLIVPVNNRDIYQNREAFKQRLLSMADVKSVTFISGEPGGFHDNYSFIVEGFDEQQVLRTVFTDYDYFDFFDLDMTLGRGFDRDFSTDASDAIVINEEAARFLGWTLDNAIGREIQNNFKDTIPRRVIGVVSNYHFRSLKEKIDPLAIAIDPDHRVIAIKFATSDFEGLIGKISNEWDQFVTRFPFAYDFLDDKMATSYQYEQKQAEVFELFALLAILIACLGLFGLSTLAIQRKLKEVGIRKVMGAQVPHLLYVLSKEFLVIVVLASVLTVPIGWVTMDSWLNNFQYRIDIGIVFFLTAAGLAIAIALLTISYHALRAARTNPVNTLRHQ